MKNRRSKALKVWSLEAREVPANFSVAAGDVAGLIAAINTANVNNQPDTIDLAAGSLYTFSAAADAAEGGSALPSIVLDGSTANGLTFNGNGATFQRSGVAGTPNFRFLRISSFPNLVSVTINDLSFANGNAATSNGGAILLNAGDLLVTNGTFANNQGAIGGAVYASNTTTTPRTVSFTGSTFKNNSTTTGAGGAVYQLGSTNVNLIGCLFQFNSSAAEGGGLRFQSSNGAVTIAGCTFAQNSAKGATSGDGGGIFVQGPATATDSVFADNTAALGGGGVWVQSGGSLVMRGCTVSGNKGNDETASGGGIFSQGPTTIENCTIHNNRAGSGGGISLALGSTTAASITHSTITDNKVYFSLATGGGIKKIFSGVLNLRHTIVADNGFDPGVGGTGPDLSGTINSLGYNLIGNTAGATITGTTTGNITGVSPNLGPLQDNGGPTFTRQPNLGSPVINAGDPAFVAPPTSDQRGAGFSRVGGGRVDIGAVEIIPAQVLSVQVNDGSSQRSRVNSILVSFNQSVSLPGNVPDAFELKRQGDNAIVTLNANVVGNAVTLTFVGGPVEFGSLADGRYTLTVLNNQVNGGNFDGNGDGTTGDDFVFASAAAPNPPTNIYRLFGDADGNGTVNSTDFATFRSFFGLGASIFDFNNDGQTNANDFGEFRKRFGLSI